MKAHWWKNLHNGSLYFVAPSHLPDVFYVEGATIDNSRFLFHDAMNKEIISDPLEAEDLWHDLHSNIALLNKMTVQKVLLFFGFSWGKCIYQGTWHDMSVATKDIKNTIIDCEKKGYGSLANDNLELFIPEYHTRIHYSYEADIHLSYREENALVHNILDRWSASKWLLVHWSIQKNRKTDIPYKILDRI